MRHRIWPLALALVAAGVAAGAGIVASELFASSASVGEVFADLFSVSRLETTIAALGPWAQAGSVGLMVLHSFVPFPAEALAIANGMLFGLFAGIALTWLGAMLGAMLAFGLARWLGRRFVQRLVGERRARAIVRWSETHGAGDLLIVRLIPIISFNLVNYAAGLAGVRWWTFVWTTAVGIVPITAASVLVGSHMIAAPQWGWWLMGAGAVGLLAVRVAFRRREGSAQPLGE
jgi:uncharacterized membrane protein YdjX (TVP38/TMEM64 family)